MITGLHHVGYVVPDLDRAVAFFTETLGLKLDQRSPVPQMGLEVASFRLGGGSTGLELMKPTTDTGSFADFLRANPQGALHHVAYTTAPRLVDAVEQAKDCGLRLAASTPNGPIASPPGWRIVNIDPATTQGLLTQLAEW